MTAANSASSSSNDVSMRHRVRGTRLRMSRHTSTPEPSGRRTSSRATSGCTAGIRCSASAAVLASPTTFIRGCASSRSIRPRRTISWSSRMKTAMGEVSSSSIIASSLEVRRGNGGPRRQRGPICGWVNGGTCQVDELMVTSVVLWCRRCDHSPAERGTRGSGEGRRVTRTKVLLLTGGRARLRRLTSAPWSSGPDRGAGRCLGRPARARSQARATTAPAATRYSGWSQE